MMLVALGILLWSLAVPRAAQAFLWQDWWQKGLDWQQEIPPPADPNRVINPEYLKKRQELEDSWNQLHRQNNMTRQYSRWTNNRSHTKYRSDNRALKKTNRLKRELRKTPMYVEQGAPPAPGPILNAGEAAIKY